MTASRSKTSPTTAEPRAQSSCKICFNFSPPSTFGPSHTIESIQLSSETGCHCCGLIWASLRETYGVISSTQRVGPYRNEDGWRGVYIKDKKVYDYVEMRAVRDQSEPWPPLPRHRFLSTNSGSDETLGLVKGWIENCTKDHLQCRPIGPANLPSRIIDVGSSTEAPHLVITDDQRDEYVALSYCWGTQGALTTTKDTLEERIQGIPLDSLPKTIRDAAILTHRAGFRYLWVDALCIIQDSKEDWEEQSAMMADVYKNAAFTICAVSSIDSTIGCFFERPQRQTGSVIHVKDPCGQTVPIWLLRTADNDKCQEDRSSGVLDSRGWTVQERLLSRRKLYCGQKEMTWECAELMCCECKIAPGPHSTCCGVDLKIPMTSVRYQWATVVQAVTARAFTNYDDVLAAVSGLAKDLQESSFDECLCGVWRKDIAWHLAWHRDRNSSRRPDTWRRRAAYYAPSWSWASVLGPVWYPAFEEDGSDSSEHVLMAELMDATCTPSTRNPFGPVSNGSITLRAPTISVRVGEMNRLNVRGMKVIDWGAYPCRHSDGEGFANASRVLVEPDVTEKPEIEKGGFYTLVILVHYMGISYHGAVLQALSNKAEGKYKRVGYWTAGSKRES